MSGDSNQVDVESLLAERGMIRRLAGALVSDEGLADDLAQEAWVAAARRGPGRPGALRAFLRGVLVNLRRNLERGESRRRRRETAWARAEALPSAGELVERAELQRLLVESVLALPGEERTAVLLRYFENLSAEEIARRSGTPAATVRSRVRRGLARLRERLETRIPERDLFPALAALTRAPLGSLPEGASPAPAFPLIGGVLLMKTFLTVAGACAVLAVLSAGIWFTTRDPGSARAQAASAEAPPATASRETAPEPEQADEAGPSSATRTAVAPEERAAPGAAPAGSIAPRIEARVVDPRGLAISGAVVTEDGERRGESGASGRVSCELALVEREKTTQLRIAHPGYAEGRVTVRVTPAARVELGDVALVPAGGLQGWVEDSFGRRVPLARVIAAGPENARSDPEELRRQGPLEDETTLSATADGDGRFRLENVPSGPARLWAGAEGFAWSSIGPFDVAAGATARGVRLVLEPLRSDDRISGFVLDPEGEPVQNARVSCWFTAATFSTGSALETDEEGRFELLLRARVAHDLTAHDPENRWSEVYLFGVEPGSRDLELRFEPARWLDVRVTDKDGKGLEEFELQPEAEAKGQWLSMEPRLDPPPVDGRTRLRLPNAPFSLSATARGYERAEQGPFDPAQPPGNVLFELAALPGIRGVVLTSDGEPAGGARVALSRALTGRIEMRRDGFRCVQDPYADTETTADGEGRFLLYPPPVQESPVESAEFVLWAEAPGHVLTALPARRFDAREAAEVELRLARGGAIEGRALAPAGLDPTGFVLAYHRGDGEISTVRLGSDGRYRLERLTPGPWEVRPLGREIDALRSTTNSTYHPDGDAPPMEDWSCTVVDGETTWHDVDLSAFAPCTVAGVLALEGRSTAGWTASLERKVPVAEVVVFASTPLSPGARGGVFELVAPQGGEYALVLRGPEESNGRLELTETLDLSPGETCWELRLHPGRIEGRGALGKGTRERFYTFEWTGRAEGHVLRARVRIVPDDDGRFVLASVPEGPGKIARIDPPAEGQRIGSPEIVAEFEVPAGGVLPVAIP